MTKLRRATIRPAWWLLALAMTLVAGRALAQSDQEREARAIEAMLIAPCCFSQQVSVHQSPAADEVRRDVRARLAAGETRQQILDAYVAQHGLRILAEPPPTGINLALYVTPVVVLLLSVALVVFAVRRFSGYGAATPALTQGGTLPMPTASPSDEARLDDELRDLD